MKKVGYDLGHKQENMELPAPKMDTKPKKKTAGKS